MKLCVDYLTYPSYNTWQTERAEELARRGENCSAYTSAAAQKRASDMAAQEAASRAGAALMQGGGAMQPAQPTGGGPATCTALFKGESIKGINKVCYYDRVRSVVAITVGAAEACPLTLQ